VHPNFSILDFSLAMILISGLTAKFLSARAAKIFPGRVSFLFCSPVLAVESWDKKKIANFSQIKALFFEMGVLIPLTAIGVWSYARFVPLLQPSVILQSYLAVFPLYLIGQLASTVCLILFLPTGYIFPAHFQYPLLSKSLSEFWGRRWASWVADWFRQMVFRKQKNQVVGFFLVFLISGLWHELLVNVPLLLYFHVNLLGSWILYFAIQALGVVGEKKFRFQSPLLRRIYLWGVVFIPIPFAINEGVLRATGFFIRLN
jgi:hypothetical protein